MATTGIQAAASVPRTPEQAKAKFDAMRTEAAVTAARAAKVMAHGLDQWDADMAVTPAGSARLLAVLRGPAAAKPRGPAVQLKDKR